MEILICDDDITVIDNIKSMILLYFKDKNIDINISEYTSGAKVLLLDKKFDIAFIDIEMPGASGLEITRYIKNINRNTIVFIITAYEGYLDDAMDLSIFRYISKPVSEERFFKNLNKAMELYNKNSHIIIVDNKSRNYNILTQNIVYATILDKKSVRIILEDREFVSYKSWKYWLKELLGFDCFLRPHYSFIVNSNYITDYDKQSLTLKISNDITTIPISRRYYKHFEDDFLKYIGATV